MKKLIIYLTGSRPSFTLPEGMYGHDWITFKRDYQYFIEKAIQQANKRGASYATIDIDSLPELSDDLNELKENMKGCTNIADWNTQREIAKNYFTFPCICDLDASGYIKKVLK